ncbi:MAG: beta-xylosidase [Chitinophagaceae bacterium]
MLLFVVATTSITKAKTQSAPDPVSITVDLNKEKAKMEPIWAWFGYDEPNYTYMRDGKKLLSELAALSPVPVYVRAHNMLTSGDGQAAFKWGSTNAYTEDASGNPIYNWTIVDSIFDTYIKRGMKPVAQFGFMPEAMSTNPQPYRHTWQPGQPYSNINTGWRYPPKDYKKWGELVYQWVKHSVDRYGQKEVESWYWELWNEPDAAYWGGTVEEYCKLYDFTVEGAKRALPTARVGGPHVTGGMGRAATFLKTFLEHCISGTNYVTGQKGTSLDFVAFHAKGGPRLLGGMVQMNAGLQLRNIEGAFKIIASYPQTKNLPVFIGESDPEGCAACGMTTNPSNAYRNGTMYSSYTAATFARKYALADKTGVNFIGAVSWSFEFEGQPWFHGFRDLATNGVDKPVLNVFRMYGKMSGKRVSAESSRMYLLDSMVSSSIRGPQTDIGALASKDAKTAAAMIWNYHDDDKQGPAEKIMVMFKGIPVKKVTMTHYRIDDKHSNSYEVWKKMGSPQNPTDDQIKQLEKAGQLETFAKPKQLKVKNGELGYAIELPRQGVSLLKLDWR